MALSKYALKKRAEVLRRQLSEFGLTPGQIAAAYEHHCGRNPSEVPTAPVERRGHEVLWLETELRAARERHGRRITHHYNTAKKKAHHGTHCDD